MLCSLYLSGITSDATTHEFQAFVAGNDLEAYAAKRYYDVGFGDGALTVEDNFQNLRDELLRHLNAKLTVHDFMKRARDLKVSVYCKCLLISVSFKC